jgi:hypothetical protein
MRATYHRRKGTEVFLGFYDVHADCLSGLFRQRKRVADVSEAFRRLRACYPRRRLFVIMITCATSTITNGSWRCFAT